MTFSEPQRHFALRKLKVSKLYLLLGVLIAGVSGIWAPFYPKYLASAAALGIFVGLIFWFKFRSLSQSPMKIVSIGLGATWFMIFGLLISRDFCLPKNISNFHRFLATFEAMGILFVALGMTILLLGARYKKDLENASTPDQSPSLPE